MKKIFLTSLFLLSVIVLSAQSDTLRTKGRKSIPTVIGKWQLDSINGSSKKGFTRQTVEFFENGDYTLLKGTNEVIAPAAEERGKWKIENGLLTYGDKSNSIANLTMKKMVLSELENKKKVFFYYSKVDYKAPRQDVIPH